MDTQATLPEPAKKVKNLKWLWVLLGVIGVACSALIAVVVIIAYLGNDQKAIGAGAYSGTIYTAPDNRFSCDFKDVMTGGFNPSIAASEDIKKGAGHVEAWNEMGQSYGVNYVNMASWDGKEVAEALSSRDATGKALQTFLNDLAVGRSPNTTIVHQEFLPTGELFVVLNSLEGSRILTLETNGVSRPADAHEGYYIFVQKNWLYLVHFFRVPILANDQPDPTYLQGEVGNFYQNCQFEN